MGRIFPLSLPPIFSLFSAFYFFLAALCVYILIIATAALLKDVSLIVLTFFCF